MVVSVYVREVFGSLVGGGGPLLWCETSEEVRYLQLENQKLCSHKPTQLCFHCSSETCTNRQTCPAVGKQCANCSKMNHFAQVCQSKLKEKKQKPRPRRHQKLGRLSSVEEGDSKESSGRAVIGKLGSTKDTMVKLTFSGTHPFSPTKRISLVPDTGVSKTLLNHKDWAQVKDYSKFVKTSKQFCPFGTAYHLSIEAKAKIHMTSINGATIELYVYIVNNAHEKSLLGKEDAL